MWHTDEPEDADLIHSVESISIAKWFYLAEGVYAIQNEKNSNKWNQYHCKLLINIMDIVWLIKHTDLVNNYFLFPLNNIIDFVNRINNNPKCQHNGSISRDKLQKLGRHYSIEHVVQNMELFFVMGTCQHRFNRNILLSYSTNFLKQK